MDFVYLPNLVLPTGHNYYQPSFYNYDQPWTHGSAYEENSTITPYDQEIFEQKLRASKEKNHCELCRKNKQRSLAAYIKDKSKMNSSNEIHEEEEEDIDDAETNNSESTNINNATTVTTTDTTTKKINENTNKQKKKTSKFKFWL